MQTEPEGNCHSISSPKSEKMHYCLVKWRLKEHITVSERNEASKQSNKSQGCPETSSEVSGVSGGTHIKHEHTNLKQLFDCPMEEHAASAGRALDGLYKGLPGTPGVTVVSQNTGIPLPPSCQVVSPTQWGSLMAGGISFHGVPDTNSLRD